MGKTYYSIKYILDHVMPVQQYKYIIKLDDDSYVHMPALHAWMAERRVPLDSENVSLE